MGLFLHRMATCHIDRPHYAKGLCVQCYQNKYRVKPKLSPAYLKECRSTYRKNHPITKRKCVICKKTFRPKIANSKKLCCSVKCRDLNVSCIDPHPPIGKRFGHRVVIGAVRSQGKHRLWRVKCDCGNITVNMASRIRKGQQCTLCTGSSNRAAWKIGQRLGDREIIGIKFEKNKANNRVQYLLMRCDCGREKWYLQHEAKTRKCRYCSIIGINKHNFPSLTSSELQRILYLKRIRGFFLKLGGLPCTVPKPYRRK